MGEPSAAQIFVVTSVAARALQVTGVKLGGSHPGDFPDSPHVALRRRHEDVKMVRAAP